LKVKPRDDKEPAELLREDWLSFRLFYGPKEKTTAIAIDALKLEHFGRKQENYDRA